MTKAGIPTCLTICVYNPLRFCYVLQIHVETLKTFHSCSKNIDSLKTRGKAVRTRNRNRDLVNTFKKTTLKSSFPVMLKRTMQCKVKP